MTRNRTLSLHNLCREPFLRYACASTQRWRRRRFEKRDSKFVFAILASRCEKLFSEKLFSEPGCLREAVLEKPFSDWLFYESQQRSCSGRSCLTRSGSVRGRSERSGSANGRDTPRTYSGGASAPPQRRCSYSLHTYWETRPHGQGSQLGINDHN